MTRKRLGYGRAATIMAGAACVSGLLTGQAAAATAASPKLVLSCSGATLVATLRGSTRGFRSVTFEFGARRIVDRTKPFTVRIPAKKVAAVSLASARFTYANGQPVVSEASVPRCRGAA